MSVELVYILIMIFGCQCYIAVVVLIQFLPEILMKLLILIGVYINNNNINKKKKITLVYTH